MVDAKKETFELAMLDEYPVLLLLPFCTDL